MRILALLLLLAVASAHGQIQVLDFPPGPDLPVQGIGELPDGRERVFVCDLMNWDAEELTLRVVIPAEGDRAQWSDGTKAGEMFFGGFAGVFIRLEQQVGYRVHDTLNIITSSPDDLYAIYSRRGSNRDWNWNGPCHLQTAGGVQLVAVDLVRFGW